MIGMSPAISVWWLYWNALCIWYNQQGGRGMDWERELLTHRAADSRHFTTNCFLGNKLWHKRCAWVVVPSSSSKYNNVAIIPAGPCHLFIWHRFRCLSNSSWFIFSSFCSFSREFPFYCQGHFSWPDIHIHVLLSPQKNINVIGYIRV
jgi:hypothetical protein